jgi:putative ABC transport system ATP-binding protein
MAQEFNQTLVIVTHDVEISDYAHRIVHLRDGNIEKIEIQETHKEETE